MSKGTLLKDSIFKIDLSESQAKDTSFMVLWISLIL